MPPPPIEHFFVCVGAQKAGTTWLARVLEDHPEIFMTPVKEIHYFDHVAGITNHLNRRRMRSRYRKYHQRMWTQWRRWKLHRSHWSWYGDYMRSPTDDAWYASLFHHRQGRRFAGEITPEYAIIGRDGYAHLARLAPAARVLFIMRNPVARAWSNLLHECRSRGLDAASLSTEQAVAILSESKFEELGDYSKTLDNLAAVFAERQLKTMFYEDIHKDRLAALDEICTFIGISFAPEHFPALSERPNRSQEARLTEPVRAYLQERYRPLARAIEQRISRVPPEWSKEFAI
jgi:hypothetical protein